MAGQDIALTGAVLDASGTRGGTIAIGGGFRGAAMAGMAAADSTAIDAGTTIRASGSAGSGGTATVWGTNRLDYAGAIVATGNGGDGGTAEVSGQGAYRYTGTANLLSTGGKVGMLTLDPGTIVICHSGDAGCSGAVSLGTVQADASTSDTAYLQDTTLASALSGAAVTLSASTQIRDSSTGVSVATGTGGTLTLDAPNITLTGAYGVKGGLVLNNTDSTSVVSGVISGTGALGKTGTGLVSLTGLNTYSGGTTITAGTLRIGGAGLVGSGTINLASGATLLLNTTARQAIASNLTGSGLVQISGPAATSFVRLNGDDSAFSGTVQVDSGARLNLGAASAGSASANFVVNGLLATIVTGATFNFGSLSGSGTVSAGGGTINNTYLIGANGASTTFSGNIGNCCDATAMTKVGSGTLTITGTLAYVGATSVNAGTLTIGGAGILRYNGASGISIASGATFDWASSATQTITGVISGAGRFVVDGPAATYSAGVAVPTLTLSGANTYTGTTAINSGAIRVTNTTALSAFTLGTGAVLQVGSSSGNASFNTAASSISGSGTLQKIGTNVVTFGSSTAPFTWNMSGDGLIDVQAGTLAGGALGNAMWSSNRGSLNVAAGATFDGLDANVTVDRITGAGTIASGSSSPGYTAFTFGANGGSSTFSGTLSGALGNYAKAGAGTIVLAGSNTYAGTTTVSAGTLQIGNGATGAISATGAIDIGGGASLAVDLASGSTLANAITGGGTADFRQSGALAVTGPISGSASVTQSGAGTTTLSGADTYTGATTVNAGALDLAGSWDVGAGTATTSVASGATLIGNGVITAAVLSDSGTGAVSLRGANAIGTLVTTGPVGALALENSQSLAVGSIVADGLILLAANGAHSDLTLQAGAVLQSSASGTAITLSAGRSFINSAGAAGLSAGNGRWLVYSAAPSADTFGNLDSGNLAVWNTTFAGSGGLIAQGGNRYVFARQPTLSFVSTDLSKTYGTDASALLPDAWTVTGFEPGVTGAILGDSAATAFTGAPTLASSGATALAQVAGGPYAITISPGDVATLNGYAARFTATGALTIDKAALTITGATTTTTYNAAMHGNTYAITAGQLYGTDTLTGVTGLATATNAGTYQDSLSDATGTGMSNYAITYVNGALTIDKAALTLTGATRTTTYDGALQTNGAATLSGLQGTDSFTVTGIAAGTNAGTYADNLALLADGGTLASNYTVTTTNGALTIDKAALTITGATTTTTYNAATHGNTYAITAGQLYGTDTLTGVAGLATATNAGTYQDSLSDATGTGLSNYAITYVNGALTIDLPAPPALVDTRAALLQTSKDGDICKQIRDQSQSAFLSTTTGKKNNAAPTGDFAIMGLGCAFRSVGLDRLPAPFP